MISFMFNIALSIFGKFITQRLIFYILWAEGQVILHWFAGISTTQEVVWWFHVCLNIGNLIFSLNKLPRGLNTNFQQ